MRSGHRSTAQSHKTNPDNNRSSDYATSPPEPLAMDYDGRDTVRLQRFETNEYSPSVYSQTSPFRALSNHMEIPRRIPHQSAPIRHSALGDDSSSSEETSSLPLRSTNRPNLRDGRVRIRPRGCVLLSLTLAFLSVVFLALIGYSFQNLQRDPKGCKMSFMYPSYAKLEGFDTEHTRFATKYSLYLYREQEMDSSMDVLSPYARKLMC